MKTGETNIDLEYKDYVIRIISTIKDVLKNEVSSGTDKGEAHYLSMCLDLLKRLYQMDRKWSRFHAWSYESTEEVTHIWNTIQPELAEFIEGHLKQLRSKKMTKDIKASSAKAVIDAAMKEAGLKADIVQIACSRAEDTGRLHMLKAENPIFIIRGMRA